MQTKIEQLFELHHPNPQQKEWVDYFLSEYVLLPPHLYLQRSNKIFYNKSVQFCGPFYKISGKAKSFNDCKIFDWGKLQGK